MSLWGSWLREYEMVLSHQEALYAPLAVLAVARYLKERTGRGASRRDLRPQLDDPVGGSSKKEVAGTRCAI